MSIVAVVFLAYFFGAFNSWQEQLTDRFFITREQPSNIIVVAVDEVSLAEYGQWPWPREVFAKAIGKLQSAKAIGIDINFSEPSRVGPQDDAILAQAISSSQVPIVLPLELRTQGDVLTNQLPIFAESSQQGFVNVRTDVDGVVRKIDHTQAGFNSFSSLVLGKPSTDTSRIAYKGPAKTFLTFSIADVINEKVPEYLLKDSYVLIGATSASLRDTFKTPFGLMPGVEVHANALSTLRDGQMIQETSPSVSLLLIALASLFAIFTVVYIRSFVKLTITLLIAFIAVQLTAFVLFSFDLILHLLYIDLSFILSIIVTLVYEFVVESNEKRFIRKSFQYYLSPAVVEELTKNPEKLSLGGERRKLTMLFSDIRGFTTISESLSPEDLTHLINEYLTAMTDIIMDNSGLVDKYIGDAIWGAPIFSEKQAYDSAKSTILMLEKLAELNKGWKARNIPELGIGIGLNTGEVIVGNMGSSKRFNYTVMGDEVNFASRLEGLNKMYGTQCIVSENTARELAKHPEFILRELDLVMVKGKKEPKLIFELVYQPDNKNISQLIADFSHARSLYTQGSWDKAIEAFIAILATTNDGPSNAFIERCREMKQNPPAKWNGVYEFHSK
jgi:adenylate cyclase